MSARVFSRNKLLFSDSEGGDRSLSDILNTIVAHSNHRILFQETREGEYLQSRSISRYAIEKFQLGAIGQLAYSDELHKLGLFNKSRKQVFNSGITIPIFTHDDILISLALRLLDDPEKKYFTTRSIDGYSKSNTFYGFNIAKPYILKRKFLLLVEGYFDVVAAHMHGYENTIAICGTDMSDRQLLLLEAIARNNVEVLCLMDGDTAGNAASGKIINQLRSMNIHASSLRLHDGVDPCEAFFLHPWETIRMIHKHLWEVCRA